MRFRRMVIVALLMSAWCVSAISAGFVTTAGTDFMLDGSKFYFSGGCSYLMTTSRTLADAEMDIVRQLRLKALRLWGFHDGLKFGDNALQPEPGSFNEERFKIFDYVIAKCDTHSIKLVLPLINFWEEYGGVPQYVEWSSTANEDCDFYTDEQCKTMYKTYVNYFLNRTNTITGRQYKNEPTIMIWEPINEPRCRTDSTGEAVAAWVHEMAGYIKSIDQNHLVGSGEEGFLESHPQYWDYPWKGTLYDGTDFNKNNASPNIDVCSIHEWPDHWFMQQLTLQEFPSAWIREHKEDANALGKPLYMGEFGAKLDRGKDDLTIRNAIYDETYKACISNDVGGALFWHLTSNHDPDALAGDSTFPVFAFEDETTCQLIVDFSDAMLERSGIAAPTDITPPLITSASPNGNVYSASVVLTVKTNEEAYARYSTSDQSYDQMSNQFTSGEGKWIHTVRLSLPNNESSTFYVRVQDLAGNATTSSETVTLTVNTSGTADNVLVCEVEGLSGDPGPDLDYPSQAGVNVEDVQPKNMEGAVKISASVRPIMTSSTGTGDVRMRFFVKTDVWAWSAASDFIDLAQDEWATVEQTFDIFRESLNLGNVRSLGIQFTTLEGTSWTGTFLVNDVVVETDAGEIYKEDFEDGSGGWEKADVGGNSLAVTKSVSFTDGHEYGEMPIDYIGGGNRVLAATVADMTGDSGLSHDYPDQAGVNVENITPEDMTSATKITARMAPVSGTVVSGSGLIRARFFIKTGEEWAWASAPGFVNLTEGEWYTVEQQVADLELENGDPPDLANVQSLGVQFTTTEGLTWSGTVLVDDISVHSAGGLLYEQGFENGSGGWKLADVGGNSMEILTSSKTAAESDYSDVPVLPELVTPARRGITVSLQGTCLAIRVGAMFASGGLVEVYSPVGRRIAGRTLDPGQRQATFHLPHLASGVHLVSIKSAGAMQTERILVARR